MNYESCDNCSHHNGDCCMNILSQYYNQEDTEPCNYIDRI